MSGELEAKRHQGFLMGPLKAIIPILLAAIFIVYILSLGERARFIFPLLAAYLLPPAGKESVIPLGISLGISPLAMALFVAIIDAIVGLFVLWNYPLLYKVPILGKWAKKAETKAQATLQKRRAVGGLAYVGLALLVVVPFQGSGAITATVVGRMAGMGPWRVWVVIIVGSVVGALSVAYFFGSLLAIFR
jgi:hypothetical protein